MALQVEGVIKQEYSKGNQGYFQVLYLFYALVLKRNRKLFTILKVVQLFIFQLFS